LFSDKKSIKAGFLATLFVGQKKKENLISKCKSERYGKPGVNGPRAANRERRTTITLSSDHTHFSSVISAITFVVKKGRPFF